MRINLFFITRISFLLLFSFFFQYQFIKASEVKSEEKQLSQLWKSAIKNNINRDHYAALKDYSKALEIAPKNHFLFYNRGLTYVDLQLLTQAKSDFDKVFDKITFKNMNEWNVDKLTTELKNKAEVCEEDIRKNYGDSAWEELKDNINRHELIRTHLKRRKLSLIHI